MELKSPSLLSVFGDGAAQKGSWGALDQAASAELIPVIRPSWSLAVASLLQPIVGELLDTDCEHFDAPFRRLAARTPPPANVPERLELKARYMEFTLRLGSDFHTRFHLTTPPTCGFLPIESTARVWFDSVTDPRDLLTTWASAYVAEFGRYHPMPPAWKAARALRQRVAQPANIGEIASTAGASRSALVTSFRSIFGMPPTAFHARVRVAHGLIALRHQQIKVEDAARVAGFASVKNFNRAVGHYTALTPSQVRLQSEADFERLLVKELQTDPVVLARRAARERPSG